MFAAHPRPDLRGALVGAFIASLCGGALIAIVAILADAQIDDTTARVLLSAGALTIYSLTALAAHGLAARRPDLTWLSTAGLAASALGLTTSVIAIWLDQPNDDGLVKAAFVLLIAALSLAHSSALLRVAADGGGTYLLRRLTVGAGSALAAMSIAGIVTDGDLFNPRALAVVAVLFLLGNILVPLVRLTETRS